MDVSQLRASVTPAWLHIQGPEALSLGFVIAAKPSWSPEHIHEQRHPARARRITRLSRAIYRSNARR